MLYSRNLQDRDISATCSLKSSWSSRTTPRFLAEREAVTCTGDGVKVLEVGRFLWGMESSSVLLRVELQVITGHPWWDVSQAGRYFLVNLCGRGRERQEKLSIISITVIGKTMWFNYWAKKISVEGKLQRSQYRALWDSCEQGMWSRDGPPPGNLVGCNPREGSPRKAHLNQGGNQELVVDHVKCCRQVNSDRNSEARRHTSAECTMYLTPGPGPIKRTLLSQ